MPQSILSLDFYGNEIIAALASLDEETDTLRLRHVFRQPCRAFSGALVRDMQEAQEELTKLLSQLNQYTLYNPAIVVGLRGSFLSYKRSSGFQSVDSRSRIIGNREIDAAIHNSIPTSLSETLEVVDILPQSYTVDGNVGILNPKGMAGFTLEVETFLSCALSTHLQTFHQVLKNCGCEDVQTLPATVALAETLVKPAERNSGVLVLDIGQTHTSAAMYRKGALVEAWELSIGQQAVLEATAELIQNDLPTVQNLLSSYEPGSDEIMDEVLEDAQIKLLQQIKKEFIYSPIYLKKPVSNIILCGERTDKPFQELVKNVFNASKVRVGTAGRMMTDCPDDIPAATGAISLLHHFLERNQNEYSISQPKEAGLLGGLLNKLGFNSLFE